jgi:endonuclease/exonuclease/phosphatase family metal-dependent hydrolase
MPRAAMATLVETSAGPVRVFSTHLEFHSERQRLAQAERLCALHAEAVANEMQPPAPGPGAYALPPRAAGTLVCGDFNFELASAPYRTMLRDFADAWPLVHGAAPHAPTCGIFDHAQWKQGAHARDFWFVSAGLSGAVTGIAVDTVTDASDHQPVWLSLSPSGLPRAA